MEMNDEKEDPILAAPNLPKEELPSSTSSTIPTEDKLADEKETLRLNYDQRRVSLLNNPTYGIILAFLDKFRAHIDIQDYPLHLLEENLLSDQENISRRLIDFHLTLLKRISLGKGAQREKFVSIITKFAYRFDYDDGEYLKIHGYSQAEINIKLRILKVRPSMIFVSLTISVEFRISWKRNLIIIKLLKVLYSKNLHSKFVLKLLVVIVRVHSIGYFW